MTGFIGTKIRRRRTEADDYPKLKHLADFYFDEDYDVISEDPDDIVRVFKYDMNLNCATQVRQEVDRFMEKYGATDQELEAAFDRVFRPQMLIYGFNGRTLRQALERIVDILFDPTQIGVPRYTFSLLGNSSS